MASIRSLSARASALLLTACAAALTGCLGSPEPYHPGYEPRPIQETIESAEARALRLAVPVEIDREDTHLAHSRQEVGRIMGDVPRNPWSSYEWQLDDELNNYVKNMGPEFGARPILGRRPVPRPDEIRKPEEGEKPAEGGSEGGSDSGESEGGDESGGGGDSSESAEDYGY